MEQRIVMTVRTNISSFFTTEYENSTYIDFDHFLDRHLQLYFSLFIKVVNCV